MKTLVFIVCLLISGAGVAASHADEIITPIATISGHHPDSADHSILPTNNVVTNQKSLAQIWTKLGLAEPVPTVNWKTEIMLVGSLSGPNKMKLGPIEYSADSRKLKFVFAGTRMAGPGFGYSFSQIKIPDNGIKSINGKLIGMVKPKKENKPGNAAADLVTIDVLGTIRTGLMAIGGETTGTEIRSGNMTFEIDLGGDQKLKADLNQLKKKRARVIGKLTKRRGVERGDRWIIKATSIQPATPKPEATSDIPNETPPA